MGSARQTATRLGRGTALLCAFLCVLALVPRLAGALVLHAHVGHGLHTHLVSEPGFDSHGGRNAIDVEDVHRRAGHDHDHEHDSGRIAHHDKHVEIVVGLPGDPIRSAVGVVFAAPVPMRCPPFLAAASGDEHARRAELALELPARPRGDPPRSGARVLMRTSSALLL